MIPKTKIIATLGPASNNPTVLRKMFLGGLDLARLNFSHGSHCEHLQRVKIIRDLNKKLHRSIKIMQDLEGYRLRVGKLKQWLDLKKGQQLYITQEEMAGDSGEISFDYQGSLKAIKKGSMIYIDDGRIALKVTGVEKRRLKTKVLTPGVLKDSKGINIPQANLEFEAITAKDKKDLKVGVKQKFDYIAQSFVRSAKDLKMLKKLVLPKHTSCKFYAKVENHTALLNIDEIIDEADGVIVARGDLGICLPIYKVPIIQKEIVKKCRLKKKPVVVATQMLDSMTEQSLPTRAEVSDVANAILDGATHLLLSGETAVGRHPARVIEMMNKIIKNTENYQAKLKDLIV